MNEPCVRGHRIDHSQRLSRTKPADDTARLYQWQVVDVVGEQDQRASAEDAVQTVFQACWSSGAESGKS